LTRAAPVRDRPHRGPTAAASNTKKEDIMTFSSLKQLFTASPRLANDGPTVWIGDRSQSTLANPDSGKLYAYVWDDGDHKYFPRVVVSPWRAIDLVRRGASLVSLLCLPRCTVELCRVRSMTDAQELAEYALGLREPAE
jgi:hypothetical protein